MPPAERAPPTASGWDKYKKIKDIGRGGFGTVYMAQRIKDGEIVAIKVIDKRCNDYGERERRFMQENNNPKFVKLIDSFTTEVCGKKNLCLVMPYYKLGSLLQLVREKKKLSQFSAAFVMKQVASALHDLHTNNVMHRDVTPGNLLIHSIDGEKIFVHLADFGLVRKLAANEKNKLTCVGTPGFLAPQVKNHEDYSYECDIFSLGQVFYNMITGELPSTDGSAAELRRAEEIIRTTVSLEAADFFKRLTDRHAPIKAHQIPFDPYIKSWMKDRSRVSAGPSTLNDPRRARSASAECSNHIFVRGECVICRLPDPNNKENNRDSAFESGDAQPQQRQRSRERVNRQPRRTPSNESNHRRQRTVSANDVNPEPERLAKWPVPEFGHLAPHTYVCRRGRFILRDANEIIAEHIDSNDYVDLIMKVKVVSQKQSVETYRPIKTSLKLPSEKDDPLPVKDGSRKRYQTIRELSPEEYAFYNTITKSIDNIAGRVPQLEYVNILDIHHLHAKLMYNGDFRLIYPSHRIFLQKYDSLIPKGCGDLSRTPMTNIEEEYFKRARKLIQRLHKVYKEDAGPNYSRKTTIGQKLHTMPDDRGGSAMPSDKFDTATFATRKNSIRRTK